MLPPSGGMVTTVALVREHLRNDFVMRQALLSDYLSVRRAARRLIEVYGWDTSEEAVVSAMRRFEPEERDWMGKGYDALKESATRIATDFGVLIVRNKPDVRQSVEKSLRIVDEQGPHGVFQNSRLAHYVVSSRAALHVKAAHPNLCEDVRQPACEVGVSFPKNHPGAGLGLNMVRQGFTTRRIPVLASYSFEHWFRFIVPGKHSTAAYDTVLSLRRPHIPARTA